MTLKRRMVKILVMILFGLLNKLDWRKLVGLQVPFLWV